MFDANGEIRWYLDLSWFEVTGYKLQRLKNGNFIVAFGPTAYEYDMVGRQVRRWNFPGYAFHHDLIEKPDGNLIVAVNKQGKGTIEDHVIEVSRTTGAIVREWDLRQVLDVQRRAFLGSDTDWFHMNSVWYDQRDNSIIVSGRHQGVAKLSADNKLVWILAPHLGWRRAGNDATGLLASQRQPIPCHEKGYDCSPGRTVQPLCNSVLPIYASAGSPTWRLTLPAL